MRFIPLSPREDRFRLKNKKANISWFECTENKSIIVRSFRLGFNAEGRLRAGTATSAASYTLTAAAVVDTCFGVEWNAGCRRQRQ